MEINNREELRAAILDLEDRKQREKQQLLDNFHDFTESLKPLNLIRSTFIKVKETPGITGNILKATVGLGVGFLSKRLLLGKSPGILKKILGSAIELGVAGLVTKKSETIKSSGIRFLRNLFGSKSQDS